MVDLWIRLAAELRDHGSIDLHASGRDQPLRLPPRGDSGRGDEFLQAFEGHVFATGERAALDGPPLRNPDFSRACRRTGAQPAFCVSCTGSSEDPDGAVSEATLAADAGAEDASVAALSAGISSAWNDSATSFSNSSMLGNSLTSFSPKRIRNSFVVLYRIGRPITCLRPAVVMSLRSSSVAITPPGSTPRMSLISGTVTGCL